MSQPTIAIILPAYNEEATIEKTILGFAQALPEASIIVVDNNSKDRTRDLAAATLDSLPETTTRVIAEPRQGKGNAVRRAFHEVDADVYLLSDADLTYPPERARELIQPILDGRADMVVGDRHTGGHYARENSRSFHELGNRLVQGLVNLLFDAKLADVMSGYRAFSRCFIKNYPILVEGFQIETEMTLHALYRRFRVLELPIAYKERPPGSVSKLNTIADGAKVLFAIAQILRFYRPLYFFAALATLFALSGILASIPHQ